MALLEGIADGDALEVGNEPGSDLFVDVSVDEQP